MPLKLTFTDRTRAIIEHERGKYVCPLLFPEPTGQTCPIDHPRWKKGGCTADMPTSPGARLRYQLDRHSPVYKQVYKQRTATKGSTLKPWLLASNDPICAMALLSLTRIR